MEGMPLNLGSLELDGENLERACALLQRSAEIARQRGGLHRVGSWALAELAEAAIRIGEHARAREALRGAREEFRRYRDARGLAYLSSLESRLGHARER
jgi:hypothetical protein